MAKMQGVKEKLHWPLYDAFLVPEKNGSPPIPTFESEMSRRDPRVIRFFVDVQSKTKLETNLQASGVLPSLNTFEARALRVVTSNLHKFKRTDTEEEKLVRWSDSELLAELIYSSVTTLLVGEKVMIEMPTFYFPSGAGVSPGSGTVTNHGEPDPMATFRFSEPVTIEPNQNFRVEMMFPHGIPGQGLPASDYPPHLAQVTGPFRLWVVLDGYLTRDVQ